MLPEEAGDSPAAGALDHAPLPIGDDGGPGAFAAFRFGLAERRALPGVVGRDAALFAEFAPILAAFTARPLGDYARLSDLTATLEPGAAPLSAKTQRIVCDMLLDAVDRELQDFYRQRLERESSARGPLAHKVAALSRARDAAQRIVSAYGWRWLARWLGLGDDGATMLLRRLSNHAFPVTRVNFRLTYHCNIACRHCYNESGPHRKPLLLALDKMLAIVAEAPSAGVTRINISGGEPFLYPDETFALVRAARAAGIEGVSVYTNGFFATTPEKTRGWLARLAEAGFMQGPEDHLKVSSGVYHEEFIAFDRILMLADAHHAAFNRPLRVDVDLPVESGGEAQRFEERVRNVAADAPIRLSFRRIQPVGRGRTLELAQRAGRANGPCAVINQIVFDPDGTVRPCCGLNTENRGIVIGDMARHGLRDLVKRMQNDPILQLLATEPMERVFELRGRSRDPAAADICVACQNALGDLDDKGPLEEQLAGRQRFYPFWFALAAR